MGKTPLQPQDKYVLRLPDGMRDWLKNEAERNGRSLNAEIVLRLSASMGQWPPIEPLPLDLHERVMNAPIKKRKEVEREINEYIRDWAEVSFPAHREYDFVTELEKILLDEPDITIREKLLENFEVLKQHIVKNEDGDDK